MEWHGLSRKQILNCEHWLPWGKDLSTGNHTIHAGVHNLTLGQGMISLTANYVKNLKEILCLLVRQDKGTQILGNGSGPCKMTKTFISNLKLKIIAYIKNDTCEIIY